MPKADISIPAALATATIVYGIQGRGLPEMANIRANGESGDVIIESVRKQNAWMSAGVVAGISLITKDPVIFIVGGAMVVAFDWLTRINNYTNPLSNKVEDKAGRTSPAETVAPDTATVNYDLLTAVA
jgi:hypothetical protein